MCVCSTHGVMTRQLCLLSGTLSGNARTRALAVFDTANKPHFGDFNDNDVSSDPSEERGSRRVLIACLQVVTECEWTMFGYVSVYYAKDANESTRT